MSFIDEIAVRAFYATRNPSKLGEVRAIVAEAQALGLTQDFVMKSLRDKYEKIPPRADGIPSPAAPTHTSRAVVAAEKNTDASPYGATKFKNTDAVGAKSRAEHVLQEEVRQWMLQVLAGVERPEMETLQTTANPVDAMRNGALLVALVARLKDPGCSKLPPIATGENVYRHLSNISSFIETAAAWVPNGFLFHGPDLCDGKNDRAVITCLLAVGRWALDNGRIAPRVASMEKEIDNMPQPSEAEIADAIKSAEVEAELAPEVEPADVDPADIDFAVAAILAPEPAPQPQQASAVVVATDPVAISIPPTPTDNRHKYDEPSSPKRYAPKAGDTVDQRVGKAFNSFLAVMHKAGRRVHSRIVRTRNQGEYIIYHRITGKRTVVYVRELSNALMIRVGGGWEDFDSYLSRRLVDVEVVPRGTAEERDRISRRRANTGYQ